MHWTVILTALTLAMISAWLVLVDGWQLWKVFLMVEFIPGTILVVFTAMVYFFSEDREETWQIFVTTAKNDWDEMLKTFWIRRK
jgi:hypothetical protein